LKRAGEKTSENEKRKKLLDDERGAVKERRSTRGKKAPRHIKEVKAES